MGNVQAAVGKSFSSGHGLLLQRDRPVNPALWCWNWLTLADFELFVGMCSFLDKTIDTAEWRLNKHGFASVLEEIGLYEVEHYIQKRRETVMEFVENREIFQACKELEVDSVYTTLMEPVF